MDVLRVQPVPMNPQDSVMTVECRAGGVFVGLCVCVCVCACACACACVCVCVCVSKAEVRCYAAKVIE